MLILSMLMMGCTCSAPRSMCIHHGHAAHAQHAVGPDQPGPGLGQACAVLYCAHRPWTTIHVYSLHVLNRPGPVLAQACAAHEHAPHAHELHMLRCAEHVHAPLRGAWACCACPTCCCPGPGPAGLGQCTRHSFERTHACGVCTAQACARPVQLMSMLRMLMSCTCSAARSMCMLRCAEHGHAAHAQHAAGPVRQCFNCIQGPRPKGLGPRPRA